MGTRITNLQVSKVVDGDTIKVVLQGAQETLRLTCVDTEESWPGGSKPVTEAGKAATAMAKQYFAADGGGLVQVDLEFDTDDPVDVCLEKHRDNYGRLLCYVHKDGDNYNHMLVQAGWSPYFVKYGRSRVYHKRLTLAEAEAQANNRVIWDPLFNQGGPSRDYAALVPWWSSRALAVQDYRRSQRAGVLSVRLDYQRLVAAADTGQAVTVFCDLQDGINKWTEDGALIYAGSVYHKFNLWIPDAYSEVTAPLLRLIEKRYAGQGRNYVYVSGEVTKYRNIPQIELTNIDQLSDFPSKASA